MNKLENLKEIADRALGGLEADTRLLHQILHAKEPERAKKTNWRPILVGVAAAAVLLCAGLIALPHLMRYDGDISVVSHSAGGSTAAGGFALTAAVPKGSVRISDAEGKTPSYRNLFAPAKNGSFPLVKLGDETYRLLTAPENLSDSLLGDSLGTVAEFTAEPAVSTAGIVSNAVEAGQTVYAVKGMKGAVAAAQVNGSMRAFQRVSFSGVATVGGEGLRDVLLGGAQVAAMELSDVGVIDDASQAQALMDVLVSNAQYEGAAVSANNSQSLLIWLSNGLTVQMNAGSGTLSACGTWSCPEFFSAYADAVNQ